MKTLYLKCSVCGGYAPGHRHWYNQDQGFGCCSRCYQAEVKKSGHLQAIQNFGHAGIHHSIEKFDPEAQHKALFAGEEPTRVPSRDGQAATSLPPSPA